MLLLHPIQERVQSEYKKDKAPSDDHSSEVIMKIKYSLIKCSEFELNDLRTFWQKEEECQNREDTNV
jgi:hypothetical protein